MYAKQRPYHQNNKSIWVPALICGFFKLNGVISTRNISLNGSQPPSVVLCTQNSEFSTRITILHGPRFHLWFCACKTAWLAPEWLVSKGPSPHLWFCSFKTATLPPELQVTMCPSPRLWICECKTAFLAPEWQVYMGFSQHLWFCACKTAA